MPKTARSTEVPTTPPRSATSTLMSPMAISARGTLDTMMTRPGHLGMDAGFMPSVPLLSRAYVGRTWRA